MSRDMSYNIVAYLRVSTLIGGSRIILHVMVGLTAIVTAKSTAADQSTTSQIDAVTAIRKGSNPLGESTGHRQGLRSPSVQQETLEGPPSLPGALSAGRIVLAEAPTAPRGQRQDRRALQEVAHLLGVHLEPREHLDLGDVVLSGGDLGVILLKAVASGAPPPDGGALGEGPPGATGASLAVGVVPLPLCQVSEACQRVCAGCKTFLATVVPGKARGDSEPIQRDRETLG